MAAFPHDFDAATTPTEVVSPDQPWDPIQSLGERLAAELADEWRAGRSVLAEEFLKRHPKLADYPQAAFRVICEEICLRQEAGQEVLPEDYLARFPRWRAEIQLLLDCHQLLQPGHDAEPFPLLDDFHSMAELGRGAQGRVYLAKQISLGDRPVILKVTPRHGREHLSLARLQHTHIAPLYWVHDDPEHDRRVLCMPFFGTVTLAAVLVALKGKPVDKRTGEDLLRVLDEGQAKIGIELPGQGPARQFLARASYVQAICYIGACLADALKYAHDRDLVHLDLKPSNVLLAGDGQPMLLDFHLAREPINPDGPSPRGLGGTPAYMSPEQQRALKAVSQGARVPVSVDGRSDIYSLSVILYQLLGGPVPLPEPPPRIDKCNPEVSLSLADLLHKCLDPEPESRYLDAGALAADFRRHLADQPLRGVRNRSVLELWSKWRRRRPQSLAILVLIFMVASFGATAAMLYHSNQNQRIADHRAQAQKALNDGQNLFQEKEYARAAEVYAEGLDKARATQVSSDLVRDLRDRLRRAERYALIQRLHQISDAVRFAASAIAPTSTKSLARLEKNCRDLWEARGALFEALAEVADERTQREQVRADLQDLALIWTDLRVRLTRGASQQAEHRAAMEILDEAAKLFGRSCVLERARCQHARALGLQDETEKAARAADDLPRRFPWEFYALGRSYLDEGDLDRAARAFDKAVAMDPSGYWPNFYQGVCAYRQGRFADALAAFRAAIAIQPGLAPGYFNRAMAHEKLSQLDQARADYDRALRIDPALAAGYLNRGLVYYRQKNFAKAQADFEPGPRVRRRPRPGSLQPRLGVPRAKPAPGSPRQSPRSSALPSRVR
jgi:eukaryotic-like serine/threonine-protein kinase